MSEAEKQEIDWKLMPLSERRRLWPNLANYCRIGWNGRWGNEMPAHLRFICRKVMETALTPNSRLIVSTPPRHAKSQIMSINAPCWFLSKFPDKEVIQVSSTAQLAEEFGLQARELMKEMEPVTDVGINTSSRARGRWRTQPKEGIQGGGGMTSVGALGTIIGRGASLILMDDLVKNDQMAMSPNEREKLWAWYQGTLRTRLEPGGSIILIMQRWHEDDIAGRLLEAAEGSGENWEYIRLPAIAEEDDPLGRVEGEALWPEKIPLEELAMSRQAVGEYVWHASYQQDPKPKDGMLFQAEDFGYWRLHENYYELTNAYGASKLVPKATCRVIMSLDMAGADSSRADYTVAQVWAATPMGELILVHTERFKAKSPDMKERVKAVYMAHRPNYILAENNGMQNAICDDLLMMGLPINKTPPMHSKEQRAQPLLMKYQERMVYHPKDFDGYTWVRDYEYELLKFPAGKNDDQVDAAALVGADVPTIAAGDGLRISLGEQSSVNAGIGGW